MPPGYSSRRGTDGDRMYVTRISLTEDGNAMHEPKSRHGRNSSHYTSSDCSDSGYYQEIPVEVYLKPKTTRKNHSQKPRAVISKPESPEPETKLYVYIPEEVSLDGSFSDDSAVVHQVHSGYRQDKLPKPQQVRLVQKKPTAEVPPGYKMVPATYVQRGPRISPAKETSNKTRPIKVNPVKARVQETSRGSPRYREAPSYEDFSEQHSSEWPMYPQQSSPVQFRKSRPHPQAKAVKKPQPVRPMTRNAPARNLPPHMSGGFRQTYNQQKQSKPQSSSVPIQHYKKNEPYNASTSETKAFKSMPVHSINVRKSKPQMPLHNGGGWGRVDKGRVFSPSDWGRGDTRRGFDDCPRGQNGFRNDGGRGHRDGGRGFNGGGSGPSNSDSGRGHKDGGKGHSKPGGRGHSKGGRGHKIVPALRVNETYPYRKYLDQDYNSIFEKCQARDKLFVDREFPADNETLGYEIASYRRIVWKRPFVDTPFDDVLRDPTGQVKPWSLFRGAWSAVEKFEVIADGICARSLGYITEAIRAMVGLDYRMPWSIKAR